LGWLDSLNVGSQYSSVKRIKQMVLKEKIYE